MSFSGEQTTSQEVSEETSGESGTEISNVVASAEGSSYPSNDSESARSHDDDTQKKKKRSRRKLKKLRTYKRGKPSNRSRSTTTSATTDETNTSQNTDEVTDKSSTEGQDTSASENEIIDPATEDPNWSMSEDFILLNMKNDDRKPSWNEIAQAMHKSKKDVKARWKVLQDNMEQPSSQDDGPSESEGTKQTKSMKEKNHKRRSRKRNSKKKSNTPVEEITTHSGDESSMKELSPEDTPNVQEPTSSSGGDSLTYAGSDREIRRQKKYLQKHIRSKLFPPDKYPTADETFTQADCEVLASVESQYKRSKWLEMQANFYNVTGRLVPIELIRARCERVDNSNGDGPGT